MQQASKALGTTALAVGHYWACDVLRQTAYWTWKMAVVSLMFRAAPKGTKKAPSIFNLHKVSHVCFGL
jgi:hypothetical protein